MSGAGARPRWACSRWHSSKPGQIPILRWSTQKNIAKRELKLNKTYLCRVRLKGLTDWRIFYTHYNITLARSFTGLKYSVQSFKWFTYTHTPVRSGILLTVIANLSGWCEQCGSVRSLSQLTASLETQRATRAPRQHACVTRVWHNRKCTHTTYAVRFYIFKIYIFVLSDEYIVEESYNHVQ